MDVLGSEGSIIGPIRQTDTVKMDVLAEIMALLRTRGHLYGRIELTAPFGLEFPGGKGICLIVTRGEGDQRSAACFHSEESGPSDINNLCSSKSF